MKTNNFPVIAALAMGAMLTVAAAPATACMSSVRLAALKAGGVQTTPAQQRAAVATDWGDIPAQDSDGSQMPGLWKFQFINADGTKGDVGFDAVAVGGVEVINSFHAPEVGNVCLGVWKQVGPHHVKINHYAPLFGADLVSFAGTLNIQEDLILAHDGKSYQGTTVFTGYDPEGNLAFQATGSIQGTRYTLKSPGY